MSWFPATGSIGGADQLRAGSTKIGRTFTLCLMPMVSATRASWPRTARIGCLACTHGNSLASPKE